MENSQDYQKILIGKRLKLLRTALGLTQEQLAEQIQRYKREISDWENGKKIVPLIVLLQLKKLYNISLDYFDPNDTSQVEHIFKEQTTEAAKREQFHERHVAPVKDAISQSQRK